MFRQTNKQMMVLGIIAVMILASGFLAVGCAIGKADEPRGEITIGSTHFSEPWILSEIAALLLRDAGFEVTHEAGLQGSHVLHTATVNDELDLYMSWTGTQLTGILEVEVTEEWDRARAFDHVKREFEERFNQTWLPPLGFNNTYAIAVRQEFADRHNLKTVSDLRDLAPEMEIATAPNFAERAGDGYSAMVDHYGFAFKELRPMDYGILYRAVHAGDVDAGVAFSTDGRITALDLAIMEDDAGFFPPYDGAFVIRMDVLQEYPEIEDILSVMSGAFDDEIMSALNAEVDVHEREYPDVAQEFAEKQGWIE